MAVLAGSPKSRALTITPWHRWAIITNLVLQVVIVVTGGAVRLTGSGLGCPTWPECTPGSYTPTVEQAEGFHKLIEFGNRLIAFPVLAGAVLACLAAWRLPHSRPALRGLGVALIAGVALQGVVGGASVLLTLHPLVVGSHMLISMGLVAASAALAVLALRRVPADRRPQESSRAVVRGVSWALSAATAVVLILGVIVTGAGPHSGDAEDPHRIQADPQMFSWLHADAVIAYLGLLTALGITVWLTGWGATAKRWVLITGSVAMAQGCVGYVQYFTGLPEILVGVHMLGASLVCAATTALLVTVNRTR